MHTSRKVKVFTLLLVLVAALLFNMSLFAGGQPEGQGASASEATFTAEPKVIGIVEPRSGPYAEIGEFGIKGVILALEEYNAQGGVLGSELKYVAEDTSSQPNIGTQKARKLITSSDAIMLVGEVSSSVANAMSAVAQELGVIYMASGPNSNSVTGENGHRVTFRTDLSNWQANRAMAGWLVENEGLRWYFLTSDYTWGHTAHQVAAQVLKDAGGTEVANDLVPFGTTDYSSYLVKIQQAKPDVLYCSVGGTDLINFLKQYAGFGLRGTITVSGAIINDSDAWTLGPGVMDGVWPHIWYYMVDTPETKAFSDKFIARFGAAPENESWQDYVSVVAYLEAVKRAGTWDYEKVIKELEGYKFDGMKGRDLYFRAWDHQLIQQVYICRSRNQWPDEWDWADIIAEVPGSDEALEGIASTRAENPVQLEKLSIE